jgi:hypothetical protein
VRADRHHDDELGDEVNRDSVAAIRLSDDGGGSAGPLQIAAGGLVTRSCSGTKSSATPGSTETKRSYS